MKENKITTAPKLKKKNGIWKICVASILGVVLGAFGFAGLAYGVPQVGNLIINQNTQTKPNESNNEKLQSTINELVNQLEQANTKKFELENEKSDLENQLLEANNNYNAQIELLQNKLTETESELESKNSFIKLLEKENSDRRVQVNNLQTKLNKLNADLKEQENNLSEIQKELESVQLEKENLQNQVTNYETQIANLQNEVSELTTDKEGLQSEIETLTTDYENQIKTLNTSISNLNNTISQLRGEIQKLTEENAAYNRHYSRNYLAAVSDLQFQKSKLINIDSTEYTPAALSFNNDYFIKNNYDGDTVLDKYYNYVSQNLTGYGVYRITIKTDTVLDFKINENFSIGFSYIGCYQSESVNIPVYINDNEKIVTPNSIGSASVTTVISYSTTATNEFQFYLKMPIYYLDSIIFYNFSLNKSGSTFNSKVTKIENFTDLDKFYMINHYDSMVVNI